LEPELIMSQETTKRPRRDTPAQTDTEIAPVSASRIDEDEGSKRIAELRKQRAERRSSNSADMTLKLSIPEEEKDPRFEYRWAVDTAGTGTRIHQLRTKDWEIVPSRAADQDPRNVGMGTTQERFANTRTVQKPDKHILMRKPKEFYAEDKAREQAKIKADEDALRKGDVKNPQGLSGPGAYVPAGGMKIEQGR
jgi:hypothetical protein